MRHRFHSLCPYFAMFPESFAETWIKRLTKPGQIVLDPFCGRGTTPFQALLMGRRAIGVDINPVAYCVSKAKTCAPARSAVLARITALENRFRACEWEPARRRLPQFFRRAYAKGTLRELLFLRHHLAWQHRDTDCMVAALVLGSLHGETASSSSYLSNQMPRTISTKPDYSVRYWKKNRLVAPERKSFELLRSRVAFRYESKRPSRRGSVWNIDMRKLPFVRGGLSNRIRCAITSPPYFDVTSYEEDQWLRRWFLGGPERPTYRKLSPDDRIENTDQYWRFLADMWRVFGSVLADSAHIVIRIGAKSMRSAQIVDALQGASVVSNRRVRLLGSETSEIRNRQTDVFRPGSKGLLFEVDCHFLMS